MSKVRNNIELAHMVRISVDKFASNYDEKYYKKELDLKTKVEFKTPESLDIKVDVSIPVGIIERAVYDAFENELSTDQIELLILKTDNGITYYSFEFIDAYLYFGDGENKLKFIKEG